MLCVVCKCKLKSFEECQEMWFNGITICKKDDCKKQYTKIRKDEYNATKKISS